MSICKDTLFYWFRQIFQAKSCFFHFFCGKSFSIFLLIKLISLYLQANFQIINLNNYKIMKKTLRYSFLSMLLMLCGAVMAQTEVTIDFDNDYATLFPTLTGVSSSSSSDGDFTVATTSAEVNGVTVTVSEKTSGTNNNRIWSSAPRLRMYSGTFTVTGKDITKIEFTSSANKFNVSTTTGSLSDKVWLGKADEVVFAIGGNTQLNKIVVTLGGEEIDPSELPVILYTEEFTQNQGKFTIDNKFLSEGLEYVWKFNNYGAVASANVSSTNYDAESWLISPVIDLTKATDVTLEFTHALNFFASIEDAAIKCKVMVKVNDGNWEEMPNVVYPTALGWTFVPNEIDLKAIADGKKLQVAFKYTSDDESAGTWEIKPFTIKGKGEATIEAEDVPATPVASVADLVQLTANTANLELTLTNAQVVLNDGNNIYVREGNAAFCLYKIGDALSKSLVNNAKVDGKLRGDFEWYNKMPEFKSNGYTDAATLNVVAVENEEDFAKPVATTLADAGKHVCDLVTLKANLSRDTTSGSTVYYLEQEDTKMIVVNNGKNLKALCDSNVVDVTVIGVVTTNKDGYQVKLTKNAIDNNAANVRGIEATENKQANVVYNLAGQRVNALRKGLYIVNGKKVVK